MIERNSSEPDMQRLAMLHHYWIVERHLDVLNAHIHVNCLPDTLVWYLALYCRIMCNQRDRIIQCPCSHGLELMSVARIG